MKGSYDADMPIKRFGFGCIWDTNGGEVKQFSVPADPSVYKSRKRVGKSAVEKKILYFKLAFYSCFAMAL